MTLKSIKSKIEKVSDGFYNHVYNKGKISFQTKTFF